MKVNHLNSLDRKQKIEVLQAIKEGKLSIECLQPPKIYFFEEINTDPQMYKMNGKEYSEIEYREFCDKIRAKYNNSIIWREGKGLKVDTIITMRREKDAPQIGK